MPHNFGNSVQIPLKAFNVGIEVGRVTVADWSSDDEHPKPIHVSASVIDQIGNAINAVAFVSFGVGGYSEELQFNCASGGGIDLIANSARVSVNAVALPTPPFAAVAPGTLYRMGGWIGLGSINSNCRTVRTRHSNVIAKNGSVGVSGPPYAREVRVGSWALQSWELAAEVPGGLLAAQGAPISPPFAVRIGDANGGKTINVAAGEHMLWEPIENSNSYVLIINTGECAIRNCVVEYSIGV